MCALNFAVRIIKLSKIMLRMLTEHAFTIVASTGEFLNYSPNKMSLVEKYSCKFPI